MRFVARITIDIEADTFADAADHERAIKKSYQDLQQSFQDCRLEIKQKRMPRVADVSPRNKAVRYTGKLSEYANG